ncbi:MAG: YjbH domain-containing protein [Alphaproteobacteria bacterium]|nr:YjbH domain-containing protein [Alphaproteobacteria bacterium]
MSQKFCSLLIISLLLLFGGSNDSFAREDFVPPREPHYSTNETGMLGLNLIPNARMDKVGTIRIGAGTNDPYMHNFIGFQLAKPLYVSLRQTSEISNLTESADRLYPGMDFKLRLAQEKQYRPAIALGIDSAFGHKKMGGEYLSFSKRYNNFDFTAGMAWGRLGSAGHIKNPLRAISSHFGEKRNFNSEQPQNISDWFTGPDIGFFGGVEYFTPIHGLSLKADYGANDYDGERSAINGFDAPDPWSVGLNYSPLDFMSLSAGVVGGKKVMARISLQDQIFNWPGRPSAKISPPEITSPRPVIPDEKSSHKTNLALTAYGSTANQIGHAVRNLANSASPHQENLEVTIKHMGLKGPTIRLIRSDLERAVLNGTMSSDEIWHDVDIIKDTTPKEKWWKNLIVKKKGSSHSFRFILDNKLSLSEEDTGPLYRSSALIEGQKTWPLGFISGARGRINLSDNLSRISAFRTPSFDPIRSDEKEFADNRFAIDQLYGSWLRSLNTNTHIGLSGGYLDEMFAGFGGEILYRPFGKTFAIGAEGWHVNKRDPSTEFNQKLASEKKLTGHLNLFYEVPQQNMTLYSKIGRYLGEDFGATFGIDKTFKNGTKLSGFVTATDQADQDIFGDTTHLYSGISFSLPLGNIPYVPKGSEIRITSAPFAHDTGQILNHPLPLYEVSEPLSSRQLHNSWEDLLK